MSFWDIPDLDLPSEKVEEIIEKAARYIVDRGLGTPAIMTLEIVKPLSFMGSQIGLLFGATFFPLIPGNWGYNLVGFFHDKENVEKLIQRVEALLKEEDEAKKLEKEKKAKEKPKDKRSLRNLFKLPF